MKKILFIFIIIALVISSFYLARKSYLSDQEVVDVTDYVLSAEKEWGDVLEIKLNPMIELDFKTRAEIYDIRKKYVAQYSQLTKEDYVPSKAVFGAIANRKPWLGILGISYYGAGEQIIAGVSEESRFIANPFLLIGLDEGYAYSVSNINLEPQPTYPVPIRLIWKDDCSAAKVWYDISDFWQKKKEYGYPPIAENKFILVAYNARDLGFNYLYVVPKNSKNIVFLDERVRPIPLRQYIHRGWSCGYRGGCNNMSPWLKRFRIKVNGLPARAYIKLWRQKPQDVNQPADMVFIIEMI